MASLEEVVSETAKCLGRELTEDELGALVQSVCDRLEGKIVWYVQLYLDGTRVRAIPISPVDKGSVEVLARSLARSFDDSATYRVLVSIDEPLDEKLSDAREGVRRALADFTLSPQEETK